MKKRFFFTVFAASLLLAGCATGPGAGTSLGKIDPPPGIPNQDPTIYVSGVIRNGIRLLILVAFILSLLWTIFAGFRFVTSGGDTKTVGQAWASIYWGIVGMLVVMGSYAIVRLVEIFFNVTIISGNLTI